MNDFKPANEPLTGSAPNATSGPAIGLESRRQLERELAEAEAEAEALRTEARIEAEARAALGEPDTLPPTWCRKCQAEVKPEGKGRCPRCGTFLRLNFARRRHPVNVLRREQVLKKLVADYRPQSTMVLASCEHLTAILEQLETMGPGSPDHQRLVQLSQQLAATLEASRAPRTASLPTDYANLSEDETLAKVLDIAHHLLDRREHRMPLIEEPPQPREASADEQVEPTTPPAPEPEPRCEYCRRTPCLGPEHHAYAVLHFNDPTEVHKREEQAALRARLGWDASTLRDPISSGLSTTADDPTAVMMKQIGKPLPPWFRR